jgi:hypothetical protein
MTIVRHMTSIFCDDVRMEQGNKLSYMGIYNGRLQLPGFPVVLPKLCVVMSVHCPGSAEPPTSLTFNLFKDDILLHEIPMEFSSATELVGEDGNIEDGKIFTVSTIMQIFPLQLLGPCELKARAICDGIELKGGRLFVETAPNQ